MREVHIQINQTSTTIPVEDDQPLRVTLDIGMDPKEKKVTITVSPRKTEEQENG